MAKMLIYSWSKIPEEHPLRNYPGIWGKSALMNYSILGKFDHVENGWVYFAHPKREEIELTEEILKELARKDNKVAEIEHAYISMHKRLGRHKLEEAGVRYLDIEPEEPELLDLATLLENN